MVGILSWVIADLIRIAYRGDTSTEVKQGHPKREQHIVKVFTRVTSAILFADWAGFVVVAMIECYHTTSKWNLDQY